jgi:hypothetical protein
MNPPQGDWTAAINPWFFDTRSFWMGYPTHTMKLSIKRFCLFVIAHDLFGVLSSFNACTAFHSHSQTHQHQHPLRHQHVITASSQNSARDRNRAVYQQNQVYEINLKQFITQFTAYLLLVYSYIAGYSRVAAAIVMAHNLCDLFLYAANALELKRGRGAVTWAVTWIARSLW